MKHSCIGIEDEYHGDRRRASGNEKLEEMYYKGHWRQQQAGKSCR